MMFVPAVEVSSLGHPPPRCRPSCLRIQAQLRKLWHPTHLAGERRGIAGCRAPGFPLWSPLALPEPPRPQSHCNLKRCYCKVALGYTGCCHSSSDPGGKFVPSRVFGCPGAQSGGSRRCSCLSLGVPTGFSCACCSAVWLEFHRTGYSWGAFLGAFFRDKHSSYSTI